MPSKSTNFIYTVAVSASIESNVFNVSALAISTEVSSIPMITLTLGGITSSAQEVTNVDVGQIIEDINTIAKFQYQNVGSCTITVTPMDGGKEQVIKLKDWTVTGVGLRDLAGSGSLAIEVTFMHPVCKLHTATITPIPNPDSSPDFKQAVTNNKSGQLVGNIIDALDVTLKEWNDIQDLAANSTAAQSAGDVKKLVERNKAVQASIATLLSVSATADKMPLQRSGLEAVMRLCESFNSIGGSISLWNMLLSEVLPTTGLIVKPTYDKEGVTVIPADYWAAPARTLNISGLSRISTDPVDIDPLYGVVVHGSSMIDSSIEHWILPTTDKVSYRDVMNYVKIIPSPAEIGAVHSISPPWFVNGVVGYTASEGGYIDPTENTDAANIGVANRSELITQQLNLISKDMADAYIYENYRKGTSTTVITPLYMLDVDGKSAVCAGDRVNIEGSTFSFFCSKVEHVIDVAGRQAYTKWVGNRIRAGSGGYDDQLINTNHPYYSAEA